MKNKYKYLLKNFGILTISSFGSKILSLILVPIYTSFLTTAEFGVFDIYTTTITLLIPVLTLYIAESVLRFSLDNNYDKKILWTAGFKVALFACMFFSFLTALNYVFRAFPVFADHSIELVCLFVGTLLYDLFTRFARGLDKVICIGIAGILNSVILLTLNIIFLTYFKFGLNGYLWAYCISYFVPIIYLCFALRIWNFFSLKSSSIIIKEMIKYSAPLVMDTVGWWVNNASDRYIVTWICGLSINGIYSVSYKIPSILNMINSIFGQAWTMSAVKEFDDDEARDEFYRNIYKIYNCGMVVVCSLLIVFDKTIAKIIFINDFYEGWKYAPFLMISVVFSALMVVMGGVFLAAKKTNELGIMTMMGAVINTILNIYLVNAIGAIGAAISTMITYVFVWVIRLIKIREIARLNIRIKRDVVSYLILLFQSLLLFLGFKQVVMYGIQSILFFCIIILYKSDIQVMINKYKTKKG